MRAKQKYNILTLYMHVFLFLHHLANAKQHILNVVRPGNFFLQYCLCSHDDFQEDYAAALAKRDAFERIKKVLAGMHKDKRSCEEEILDQAMERRQKTLQVHAHSDFLCANLHIHVHARTNALTVSLNVIRAHMAQTLSSAFKRNYCVD